MKTDLELQILLAKMLPEKIEIVTPENPVWFIWNKSGGAEIKDTEWLHVCWLIEQELTPAQKVQYAEVLAAETAIIDWGYYPGETSIDWLGVATVATASWQQRAEAILKVRSK